MKTQTITSPNSDKRSNKLRQGRLYVIAAPSGAGKTTLCRAVLDHFPGMLYSVSSTTRKIRRGEENGVDYHFISEDDFKRKIENNTWAEWAEVHGNYYGTDARFLDRGLAGGNSILLDIDVQGTLQILRRYPDAATIFIMPPSLAVLRSRLEARRTDSQETISRRLVNAETEIAQKDLFRHIVVNDRLPEAVAALISIIGAYHRDAQSGSDRGC